MEQAPLPLLVVWNSFYVIIGSAAAALIGLQFVATVLGAQLHRGSEETNRAFATPTIVYFGTILLIAAIMSAPWHALLGVALIIGLCGVGGLMYGAIIMRTMVRQNHYQPVLEDWICHGILPPVAYIILLCVAILLRSDPVPALFGVSGAVLLLLFVGIHNAWDAVTFIALNLRHLPDEPVQ